VLAKASSVAPAPAPSLATMDTEPLVREAPVAPAPAPPPPPAPALGTVDTKPRVRAPSVPPAPVPVAPPPAPPVVEPPSPAPALPKLVPAEIARTLAPVGALEIVEHALMGMALYTACGPRLARAVVASAAFRALTFLAETPAAGPVTQTTLRGAAGSLVVTPLGPRPGVGPALVVALPQRGALALLEILALRVAAEYRAAHAAGSPPPVSAAIPAGALRPAPVPARVGALVRSLASGSSLQPACLQDATGLTLHLMLEPGADAERLGRLASSLYRILEVEAEPGGIGPVQSVVVRLGSQRVVVQPVAAAGGPATLLVAATDHRPGLTRLQLERVAARLGGSPS
jgi:predicted regulator of Ras-like GTPase activity (Roadblock/LC7/MglB family)